MGILDEAIRDHLELKRKGGAPHADLQRLEDEAFGPPSSPSDLTPETGEEPQSLGVPSPDASVATSTEQPPSQAGPEPGRPPTSIEEPPTQAEPEPGRRPTSIEEPPPLPERDAPAPTPSDRAGEGAHGAEAAEEPPTPGEAVFHDFAAEEGLVRSAEDAAPSSGAPPEPAADAGDEVEVVEEIELESIEIEDPGPSTAQQPGPEAPAFDDTQPHDMEAELGGAKSAPEDSSEEPELEVSEEDLELHIDDEELDPAAVLDEAPPPAEDTAPDLRVVENDGQVSEHPGSEDEGGERSEDEGGEPAAGAESGEQAADDVLEETPEFLRETPEHDRLWFEQSPPKDFDFDD